MTTTESSQQEKINLLDLDAEGIRAWCASIGQKPFRATQLARWIHRYCCDDFDAMTNLAKEFRARLKDLAYIKKANTETGAFDFEKTQTVASLEK